MFEEERVDSIFGAYIKLIIPIISNRDDIRSIYNSTNIMDMTKKLT
jgi:hypothetical protein